MNEPLAEHFSFEKVAKYSKKGINDLGVFMSFPEIYSLSRWGEPFVPTSTDNDSGINQALVDNGVEVLAAGRHNLFYLHPVLPHSPNQHLILWFNKNDGGNISSWTDHSWSQVAGDEKFLEKTETFINQIQSENPDVGAYFFIGFWPKDLPNIAGDYTISRSTQSQKRPHIHLVHPIPADYPHRRPFTVETDLPNLSHLIDAAGETSANLLKYLLEDFGTKFSYVQKIPGLEIRRTLYGFPSLFEAINKTSRLQQNLVALWLGHSRLLSGYDYRVNELILPLRQSCVPNFAFFMFPGKYFQTTGVEKSFPVAVKPFTVGGGQTVYSGVMYEHNGVDLKYKMPAQISTWKDMVKYFSK